MQSPPTQPAVVIRERGEPTSIIRIALGIVLGVAICAALIFGGLFGYSAYTEYRRQSSAAASAKAAADHFAANAKLFRVTAMSYDQQWGYTIDLLALDEEDALGKVELYPNVAPRYVELSPPGISSNTDTWQSTKIPWVERSRVNR